MLRIILVCLVIFLIVRAFVIIGLESNDNRQPGPPKDKTAKKKKGVPKELGEYVDYEEIKKEK